jgi:RsiW-degrading membrane proteinase PrsW (M82 family)
LKIPPIIKALLYGILPAFIVVYVLVTTLPSQSYFEKVEHEIEFHEQRGNHLKATLVSLKWAMRTPNEMEAHYHFLSNYLKLSTNEKTQVSGLIRQKANDIFEYYSSLQQHTDASFHNMGDYGLTLLSNYYDKLYPNVALSKAERLQDNGLPYTNELLGDVYSNMYYDYDAALEHYLIDFNKAQNNQAGYKAIRLLIWLKEYGRAEKVLVTLNERQAYISPGVERLIYFHTSKTTWIASIYYPFIRNIKEWGTLAAMLILLVWFIFLKRLDVFKEVNVKAILTTIIAAILITPMGLLLYDYITYDLLVERSDSLWQDIFITGGIEETIKILPVYIVFVFFTKQMTPFFLLFSAVLSALAFATLENMLYFNDYYDISIVSGRAIMSVTGHLIFTSIVAYGLVLYLFRGKSILFPILCFVIAMCVHGLYNYGLTIHYRFLSLLLILCGALVWSSMVNNCLNISPSFQKDKITGFDRKGIWLITGLSGVILLEFVLNSIEFDSISGQEIFSESIISGGPLIFVLTLAFVRMDLVKGRWGIIDFVGIREIVKTGQFKEKQIVLKPFPPEKKIYGVNEVKATVMERIQSSEQENWYLIEIEGGENALIKFKNSGDQFIDFKVVMHFRKTSEGKIPEHGFATKQFPFTGWVLCSPSIK